MSAEIPQNLEDLVKREQQLTTDIGKEEELVLKIRSGTFISNKLEPPTPLSLSERIRQRNERLLEILSLEENLETELRPKLASTTALVDEGAMKLALDYEQRGREASDAFANLQKTVSYITGKDPNSQASDLLGIFPQELAELGKEPLSNPILERGLNLLDESRVKEEESKSQTKDDQAKPADKRTWDRKNYELALPDGHIITVNGSVRAKALRMLIQSSEDKLALSGSVLTSLVYGTSNKNDISTMQVTISQLRKILEGSNWEISQLISHGKIILGLQSFYMLEKIQQTEEVTPPAAPEPEPRPATAENKRKPGIPEIPAKNIDAMITFLTDPDLTLDSLIAVFGNTKEGRRKSRPFSWSQAKSAMKGTIINIFIRILNKMNPSEDEIQIHEAVKQNMQTDSEGEALQRFLRELDNWFQTKLAGRTAFQPGAPEITQPEGVIEETAETLTNDEAIILARRILDFEGTDIIDSDKKSILKVEIDPLILEAVQRIRKQNTDEDYSNLGPEQRLQIRKQALEKINRILNNEELLNSIYDNSQASADVQTLLIWLLLENEKYGGELLQLLDLPAGTAVSYNGRNLWVLGTQKQIIASNETAAKLLSARKQKEAPPSVVNPLVKDEKQKATAGDITGTKDTDEEPEEKQPEANISDAPGNEPRKKLGRQDLSDEATIYIEINRIRDLLDDANIGESAAKTVFTSSHLGVQASDLAKATATKFINPNKDRLTREEMLMLLFRQRNNHQSLRPQDVKTLRSLIRKNLQEGQ